MTRSKNHGYAREYQHQQHRDTEDVLPYQLAEPHGSVEDCKAIGCFFKEVTQSPDAFGVPADYRKPDGELACAWVWVHIDIFADKYPAAKMIAENKVFEMNAWRKLFELERRLTPRLAGGCAD